MLAVIDRFEEDEAVLILDSGETMLWPRRYVPASAGEGSVLELSATLDYAATEARRDEADRIIKRLGED